MLMSPFNENVLRLVYILHLLSGIDDNVFSRRGYCCMMSGNYPLNLKSSREAKTVISQLEHLRQKVSSVIFRKERFSFPPQKECQFVPVLKLVNCKS